MQYCSRNIDAEILQRRYCWQLRRGSGRDVEEALAVLRLAQQLVPDQADGRHLPRQSETPIGCMIILSIVLRLARFSNGHVETLALLSIGKCYLVWIWDCDAPQRRSSRTARRRGAGPRLRPAWRTSRRQPFSLFLLLGALTTAHTHAYGARPC